MLPKHIKSNLWPKHRMNFEILQFIRLKPPRLEVFLLHELIPSAISNTGPRSGVPRRHRHTRKCRARSANIQPIWSCCGQKKMDPELSIWLLHLDEVHLVGCREGVITSGGFINSYHHPSMNVNKEYKWCVWGVRNWNMNIYRTLRRRPHAQNCGVVPAGGVTLAWTRASIIPDLHTIRRVLFPLCPGTIPCECLLNMIE